VVTACPACQGKGSLIVTPCRACRGTGKYDKPRVVTVKIPAGIEDGQAVRVAGEGEPGRNGTVRGDLYAYVRVRPHDILERHGHDLVCRMHISFTQAALGARLAIPTLEGRTEVTIPRGTQPGRVLRLGGLGLPGVRSNRRGDLLVEVLVETPRKLTKRQEQLLREFAETEDKAVQPESRSFLEKLKDYFNKPESTDKS